MKQDRRGAAKRDAGQGRNRTGGVQSREMQPREMQDRRGAAKRDEGQG